MCMVQAGATALGAVVGGILGAAAGGVGAIPGAAEGASVGFGLSAPEHVAAVGKFADAAIIGSALVALIEKSTAADAPAAVGRFIAGLRA